MTDSPKGEKLKPASKGILRSSATVASMTMLSRLMGLVRDVVIARYIGANANADAFFVAFKIPNFLRRLFAEGAFAQAFVPVLSEYRARGSVTAVRNLIDRIAGCLGMTLVLLTAVVVVAAPVFTAIFGPGFYFTDPEKFWLTSDLLKITFPYILLISLTGFAGSILNSYDRFAVPAFTPVLLNICLIIAAVAVSPLLAEPVLALAWGVLIAGVVQLCFQIPFLYRLGLLPHPKVDWGDEAVRKVLRLMAPAIFGVSVSQVNLLLDTVLASFLPNGSISWLYYSDRLTELPLGVFGVGIATVILPHLSRHFTTGTRQFSQTLDWALRMILLIGLPSALALVVIADQVLYALFQYGETTPAAMDMAALSLRAYALGLTAFMLIKVLASGYFSRQDTKTPVKIGVITMGLNMVMNILFVVPLHFLWQVGHAGLALATSFAAIINAGMLYRGLRRQQVYQPSSEWRLFFVQIGFANFAMLVVLTAIVIYLPQPVQLSWFERSLSVAILCLAGSVTYAIALLASGVRFSTFRVNT